MRKRIFGIFVSLLVVAMLGFPLSVVYASKPMFVSGTFFPIGDLEMEVRYAGNSGNQILDISQPIEWKGGIEGVGSLEAHWVVHMNDPENMKWNSHGIHTLNAEVNDKIGTLTIKLDGSHQGGHWRIISGTGELASLHGQGEFANIGEALGYQGQVHFDP